MREVWIDETFRIYRSELGARPASSRVHSCQSNVAIIYGYLWGQPAFLRYIPIVFGGKEKDKIPQPTEVGDIDPPTWDAGV